MIKFLTLLNLSGILLFNAFFLTNVVITHETPATMQAGTEVKVTVTIDKGSLNGFAKLQIDLPEGLSATAIETKGASFTFADGKAKFIWMALPNQPQFKVSYTLGAAADGVMISQVMPPPTANKYPIVGEYQRAMRAAGSLSVLPTKAWRR